MSIIDYTTLRAAVADWPNHASTKFVARVATFIQGAEVRANRWLRDRNMQAQNTATISARLTELPEGFAEPISAQARLGGVETWANLDPAPIEWLNAAEQGASLGRPRYFGVQGRSLVLSPAPDQAYSIKLTYFQRLPPLSVSNPSNWLLEEAPDVYLHGALIGAYEYLKAWDVASRFEAKFMSGLAELKAAKRTLAGKLKVEDALQLSEHAWGYEIMKDA